MIRKFGPLLLLILILSACSSGGIVIQTPSPNLATGASPLPATLTDMAEAPETGSSSSLTPEIPAAVTEETSPSPDLAATLATPHIDQPPDGEVATVPSRPQDCGYQWAYQDLPEVSSNFLQSVQGLQPEAEASAFAFGENCIHTDGSITFLPMETDFNVTLQTDVLTDEAALGEWIVKVMQVIEEIPLEQISGPRPGRVSILFESNGQQSGIKFYINQYQDLPAGLSNIAIYQTLKISQ